MSCCCCSYSCQPSKNQLIVLTTERVKVLKLIGENVGQVVVESTVPIDAVKIEHIHTTAKDVTDDIFTNKVVTQGLIHKQVYYVDPHGIVREINENVPFMLAVDIPGLERENEKIVVENKLLNIETDYHLTPTTGFEHEEGVLKQKIVAHFKIKVYEWAQLDVVVKPNFCTKINLMNTIVIRNQ